jgi:HK97 gp10 family phage protein
MASGIRIEGMADLDRALRELSQSTARGIGRRAAEKALEPVAAAAKAAAPRGAGAGKHYADSIGVASKLKPSQAREARAEGGVPSRDVLVRYVGSSAPHAHLIEFGTGPRHQKNGKFTGVMPPHPHMRVAWDANGNRVLELLTAGLREELDKTLARIAKRAAKAGAQ